jgi:hypothetical protein
MSLERFDEYKKECISKNKEIYSVFNLVRLPRLEGMEPVNWHLSRKLQVLFMTKLNAMEILQRNYNKNKITLHSGFLSYPKMREWGHLSCYQKEFYGGERQV